LAAPDLGKGRPALAVIGLIDVSQQLIDWAAFIHRIVEKYAIVRAWLFGWLPFHIPPEWHDPIVLLLIFFSVTNAGIYRRTKGTYMSYIIKNSALAGGWSALTIVGFIKIAVHMVIFFTLFVALMSQWRGHELHIWYFDFLIVFVFLIASTTVAFGGTGIVLALFDGVILAWRWLLTTAAFFGALVAVNQVYVLWLEPLAEH